MVPILIGIITSLFIIYVWKHISYQLKYGYLRKIFRGININFILNMWQIANPDNVMNVGLYNFNKYKTNMISVWYPNTRLLVYDPKLAEHIFITNVDKTVEYSYSKEWLFNGLLTTSSKTWRAQKKLLAPAFSMDNLQKYIHFFNEDSLIFRDKLKPHVDGQSFDIHSKAVLCTFDVILNTALGANLQIQDNPASDYFNSVQTMCHIIYERTFNPFLSFDIIYNLSLLRNEEIKAAQILNDFTRKIIEANCNLQSSSGIRTILNILLETEGLSDEQICAELNTIIFAGYETTGSTLSFALYELSRHKEIQTKVYNEIIDVVGEFNAPNYKDLESLKYTSMFLKEVSRLYPGVPLIGRKTTKEMTWEGEVLPVGLDCYVPIFILNRTEKYFPNPDKFDPERFNKDTLMDSEAFMSFGLAPRGCIGQKFVSLELKTVLVNLLRTYEFLPDPEHQLKLVPKCVLTPKTGVKLRIKMRKL